MAETTAPAVQRVVEWLQAKQAADILLMDLRTATDTTDFFVLCSGASEQHVRALADEVIERSAAVGDPPWHVEGYATRRWVLIDFVDIVVHVFRREVREFYALERLWRDAPSVRIEDTWNALPPAGPEPALAEAVFSRQ